MNGEDSHGIGPLWKADESHGRGPQKGWSRNEDEDVLKMKNPCNKRLINVI